MSTPIDIEDMLEIIKTQTVVLSERVPKIITQLEEAIKLTDSSTLSKEETLYNVTFIRSMNDVVNTLLVKLGKHQLELENLIKLRDRKIKMNEDQVEILKKAGEFVKTLPEDIELINEIPERASHIKEIVDPVRRIEVYTFITKNMAAYNDGRLTRVKQLLTIIDTAITNGKTPKKSLGGYYKRTNKSRNRNRKTKKRKQSKRKSRKYYR